MLNTEHAKKLPVALFFVHRKSNDRQACFLFHFFLSAFDKRMSDSEAEELVIDDSSSGGEQRTPPRTNKRNREEFEREMAEALRKQQEEFECRLKEVCRHRCF